MPRIDKSKALQAAQKHLGKGNLRKALEEYERIIAVDPKNTSIRIKRAELLERLGEPSGAAAEYRRVAKTFKLGGFYPKACALLNRVAALEPGSADAHLELAELNQKLGRVAEAVRHYQMATDVEDRGRDKRHSIDILKRIAEVGAPNLDRSLEVAGLYYKEGFDQEGFEQFCQATGELEEASDEMLEITLRMCRAWPGDSRLKSRLGEIHLARSDAKAAAALFEEIVAASRNARHLALLAEAKAQDGSLDEAKALFQEAIALYEADWDVQKRQELSARLIEISADLMESTTGEILLTEVEQDTSPGPAEDPGALQDGGLPAEGDAQPGEMAFSSRATYGPRDLDTLLTESDALLALGKREKAIGVLERAAEIHPEQRAPLLRLQAIYEDSADWEALTALKRRLAAIGRVPDEAPGRADASEAPVPAPDAVPAADDMPAPGTAAEAAPAGAPADYNIQIVIDEQEMDGAADAADGEEVSRAANAAPPAPGPVLRSALTGLPIRDLFLDRVERALARAGRVRTFNFAVLVLDIDRFKRVNDAIGLARGDELLVAVAQRLEKSLRKSDTAAYLGGDEFGVLLENIRGASDAMRLARKISRRLSAAFDIGGGQVEITASSGIALSSTGYERPEALLQDAEAAMFRAKGSGKGLAEIFDESLRSRATAVLQLETDLRRAVEAGEFLIHYQPILSLDTERPCGFEALARWRHPDGNLVAPAEFIPMAEETALIVPIERWLIGEACRQLRAWQEQRPGGEPLTVSANVSGKHLAHPDFIRHLEEALTESPVSRGTLVLEVTEAALIENAEALPALIERLERLGVRLSVDDFGAGLSSLPLLQRHPFATFKIAAGAGGGEGDGPADLALVGALVGLARILGGTVVVKGVETAEQLAAVREMGCEHAQGHLFSRALAGDEASALIGTRLAG